MAQDKDLAWKRLSEILADQNVKTLETKDNKLATFSDIHLGNGGDADDFHHNQRALKNYRMRSLNCELTTCAAACTRQPGNGT